MSTDSDTESRGPEDEMLPDEREAIAERLDALDDDESKLSIEEVAERLDLE